MHIAEYAEASYNNHDPRRLRKLLLNRKELDKLEKKTQTKGLTIIPLRLFINGKGLAKLEIALAQGKKLHDKRATEAKRDWGRQKQRLLRHGD